MANLKTVFLAAIVSAGLWSVSADAAVNLITNGSFENGTADNSGSFVTLNAPSTAITGWTVTGGSIDWINNYWQAQDGVRSLDLNGISVGGIQQTISTVAGQTYALSFYVSANPDHGLIAPTLTASAGDQSFDLGYTLFPSNTHAQMGWDLRSFNFVATGSSTVIGIASTTTDNCCWGPALDNLSVSAIPESSTWAMMILGFVGIGAMTYRRSRKNSFTAA